LVFIIYYNKNIIYKWHVEKHVKREQKDVEPKDVENLFLRKREQKEQKEQKRGSGGVPREQKEVVNGEEPVEDLEIKEVDVVIVRQPINFYLFQHYLLFFF